jgi:hypothetical protein
LLVSGAIGARRHTAAVAARARAAAEGLELTFEYAGETTKVDAEYPQV